MLNLLRFSTNNNKTKQVRVPISNYCTQDFKTKANTIVFDLNNFNVMGRANSDYSNPPA